MTKDELRALALRTKPLVDGSTRSLSAFYSAMSPDRTLGLLDEIERLRTAAQAGLEALCLPCDRWNKQQTEIVNAAIAALKKEVKHD